MGHIYVAQVIKQGSQTRGPREAPMRPANIRKNEYMKGKIELFSQINWILTHNSKILYSCGPRDLTLSLMRPANPFEFETQTPAIKYNHISRIKLISANFSSHWNISISPTIKSNRGSEKIAANLFVTLHRTPIRKTMFFLFWRRIGNSQTGWAEYLGSLVVALTRSTSG